MPDEKNLANVLKNIRLARGLSLRDFSDRLGISHAYLSKLEKGLDPRTKKYIAPTMETLTKIAEGLDIPTDRFLEMCGFFGEQDSLDLKAETETFLDAIKTAESVRYGEYELTDDDIALLAGSIQISLELILKRSGH